jgi:acyl-CoA synthetase (AMP-forming)/AMP-acid ligase II
MVRAGHDHGNPQLPLSHGPQEGHDHLRRREYRVFRSRTCHQRWGEKPVAIVVLADGAALDLSEVADHCRGRLAAFKVPKQLIIRDSLPRNPSGKVLKRVLRAELEADA